MIIFPPLGTPLNIYTLTHLQVSNITCFCDNSVVQSPYDYIGMYGIVSVSDPSWILPQPYYNHHGTDIQTGYGNNIYSVTNGVVVDTGGSYNWVIINDGTYNWRYLHNSQVLVSVGQSISKGDLIAKEGNSGTDAIHLHIDKYIGSQYYDVLDEITNNVNPPDPSKDKQKELLVHLITKSLYGWC